MTRFGRRIGLISIAATIFFFSAHNKVDKNHQRQLTQIRNLNKKILFLICHHCNQDLKWVDELINDVDIGEDISVISKCISNLDQNTPITSKINEPENGTCDQKYAEMMIELHLEKNNLANDGVIAFMKDDINKYNVIRTVKNLIEKTSKSGFECLQQTYYYHWTDALLLSSYEEINPESKPEHNFMSKWLEKMGIELTFPLTQVCYGGEFMTKFSHVLSLNTSLLMQVKYQINNNNESYFMERTWANLLAEKATNQTVSDILSYPYQINYDYSYSNRHYFGAINFTADTNNRSSNIAKKMISSSKNMPQSLGMNGKVSIVMSYCRADLGWFKDRIKGMNIHDITVVSKCNGDESLIPNEASIVYWPNVGRCDHTYARWMLEIHSRKMDLNGDDIVFFLKDSIDEVNSRGFEKMLEITRVTGFSCSIVADIMFERYLEKFRIDFYDPDPEDRRNKRGYINDQSDFKSKYNNMSQWLSVMNITLPKQSRTCYGGIFSAKVSNILSIPEQILRSIERSLSRGNNIEEGHFAERAWAGLLIEVDAEKAYERIIQKLKSPAQKMYERLESRKRRGQRAIRVTSSK